MEVIRTIRQKVMKVICTVGNRLGKRVDIDFFGGGEQAYRIANLSVCVNNKSININRK